MVRDEPPTEEILKMRSQGLSNDQIMERLEREGHSPRKILEAFNQADIKKEVEGEDYQGMQESILEQEPEVPVPAPTPGMRREGEVPRLQVPRPPRIQESPLMAAMPSVQMPTNVEESIHEIVESVIDERWQQLVADFGDITLWKSRMEDELVAVKQEVLRLGQRFANVEKSLLGKVSEYDEHVLNVTTEMKALEKVFEKIVQPLTSNIKELNKITRDLKAKK